MNDFTSRWRRSGDRLQFERSTGDEANSSAFYDAVFAESLRRVS